MENRPPDSPPDKVPPYPAAPARRSASGPAQPAIVGSPPPGMPEPASPAPAEPHSLSAAASEPSAPAPGEPFRPPGEPPSAASSARPTPSTPSSPPTAERLGPYIVEKVLARGGMGEVCLALDPNLNRPVAIKRLSSTLLEDPEALERFKREARAAAAVAHPNIAGVYFVGADDGGRPFLAMEFVDGLNLVEVVRHKLRVTWSTVCDWMVQACQGLEAAHKANIIHRDLKPGNLMITRDGALKIVDFGLAKIFFEDTHSTRSGMVVGTPQYMSPEQGQGRGIDHRSDIYSLGATFYCVVTGRPPFDGPSMIDVMMKHISSPLVPVYSINPEVPLPLCDIIHRMMAKDPNERPQEYEDLIADLRAVQLQMLAREKGAFVNGDGKTTLPTPVPLPETLRVGAAQVPPPESDSNADLKAILGQTRRGAPAPADDLVTVHSMEVASAAGSDKPPLLSGFSPKQLFIIGCGLIILLVGVLTMILRPVGNSPAETGKVHAATDGSRNGLSAVINRLVKDEAQPTPVPIPPDLQAARTTVRRLNDLSKAIQSYEASGHDFPASLDELIKAQLTDQTGTLDGWNRPIAVRQITQELLSYGSDGEESTPDDIIVQEGQSATLPDKYVQLQKEYEKQLKARENQ